jgi:hypothetical protein
MAIGFDLPYFYFLEGTIRYRIFGVQLSRVGFLGYVSTKVMLESHGRSRTTIRLR